MSVTSKIYVIEGLHFLHITFDVNYVANFDRNITVITDCTSEVGNGFRGIYLSVCVSLNITILQCLDASPLFLACLLTFIIYRSVQR